MDGPCISISDAKECQLQIDLDKTWCTHESESTVQINEIEYQT